MSTAVIGSTAERANMLIPQGGGFVHTLYYEDSNGDKIDLTGWTAKLQIRNKENMEEVLYSMSTEDGRIELGDGYIKFKLTEDDTASITFHRQPYYFHLHPPEGDPMPLLKGIVYIERDWVDDD